MEEQWNLPGTLRLFINHIPSITSKLEEIPDKNEDVIQLKKFFLEEIEEESDEEEIEEEGEEIEEE